MARMGHTLYVIPAPGSAAALIEGVRVEGGKLVQPSSDTIGTAGFTWIYPDDHLLDRLLERYPDILQRDNLIIITPDQLDDWYNAVKQVAVERGVTLPA